ncbi:unnamed protein product [Phaedon cochleariae]|uniref:AAA+ ATPase domain-containing protein n=1 Tax=Phaedon cochleariae TaxID=80249 RepID=A0A9N9SCB4_PHACE|nr:unnamed protein product [Phaedon cochleariae]
MAELSITPKSSTKNILPNLYEKIKTESRERKRNIMYLIHNFLRENKLNNTAQALEEEAQLIKEYQVCENIDLEIILQEYLNYYHTKFQKYPKIVRKMDETTIPTNFQKPKSSAKCKPKINKEKLTSQEETEDFSFEITSLSNEKPTTNKLQNTEDKCLHDIENYSNEWKEMADDIMKNFIPKRADVSWDDCLGLSNTAEKLKEATIYPLLYPDLFKDLPTWKGVLLFGPPGTGKTLLATALASEGSTFINVSSSTFISKWRGESEKMIKVMFDLARKFAPTTIFIDEVDALALSGTISQHEASRRFKSELLTQIDGIQSTESNIFILGSTNSPWNIDPALLRRFEKRIFVPLPNKSVRYELLKHYLNHPNDIKEKELHVVAQDTNDFSGSDIRALCKEASMSVVREKIKEINSRAAVKSEMGLRKLTITDVEKALEKITSTNKGDDNAKYIDWNAKFGSW